MPSRPYRNYYSPLLYPLFHFPLLVFQLLSPSPLHLVPVPSTFFSPYSPVPLSSLSQTLAMKTVSHQSPGPLCQPAFPMLLQSSGHPFLNCATHSTSLTFLKPLSSTLCSFAASFSLLLTSRPLLPLPLHMPCLYQKTYKQPWPWRRRHIMLHDYRS